jgi:UDP:flavonoid glycosyltransferase YjiC (YdhE family)
VRVLVDVGRFDGVIPRLPCNVRVVSSRASTKYVNVADVVVTTGGSAVVTMALLAAKPLIVLPTGGEQRVVAEMVLRERLGEVWPTQPASSLETLQSRDAQLRCRAVAQRFRGDGAGGVIRILRSLSVGDAPQREAMLKP